MLAEGFGEFLHVGADFGVFLVEAAGGMEAAAPCGAVADGIACERTGDGADGDGDGYEHGGCERWYPSRSPRLVMCGCPGADLHRVAETMFACLCT